MKLNVIVIENNYLDVTQDRKISNLRRCLKNASHLSIDVHVNLDIRGLWGEMSRLRWKKCHNNRSFFHGFIYYEVNFHLRRGSLFTKSDTSMGEFEEFFKKHFISQMKKSFFRSRKESYIFDRRSRGSMWRLHGKKNFRGYDVTV